MKEVLLTGEKWKTENDVYDAFFEAVGAPDWHGRNFDALHDSIGVIEVPYSIKITGLHAMSSEARTFVKDFSNLIEALKLEGVVVELIVQD